MRSLCSFVARIVVPNMDDTTQARIRRFHLTPGHCLLALLAVELLLFLSQSFRWLPEGWPVLLAVAAVALDTLFFPFFRPPIFLSNLGPAWFLATEK